MKVALWIGFAGFRPESEQLWEGHDWKTLVLEIHRSIAITW
jgi:hypothetical protein